MFIISEQPLFRDLQLLIRSIQYIFQIFDDVIQYSIISIQNFFFLILVFDMVLVSGIYPWGRVRGMIMPNKEMDIGMIMPNKEMGISMIMPNKEMDKV